MLADATPAGAGAPTMAAIDIPWLPVGLADDATRALVPKGRLRSLIDERAAYPAVLAAAMLGLGGTLHAVAAADAAAVDERFSHQVGTRHN